jgi:hypothetical protein
MTKYLLLLAFLAVGLSAKEISNEHPPFKISFPDSAGWLPVKHNAVVDEVQMWTAENPDRGLSFRVMVINAPMPEAKPTFRENAEEWSRGMMESFSRKLSSRFAPLAGHEAYELVATLKGDEGELYCSNWMIEVGAVTYAFVVVADKEAKLTGPEATAFLKSLEIPK